jgi:hypothetical protein
MARPRLLARAWFALMRDAGQHSFLGQAIRGAIAGGVATWVMDLVTTALYEQESKAAREREEAARPAGRPPADNLVDLVTERIGVSLTADQKPVAAQAAHFALGIVPGAAYAVLRDRLPLIGAARGLVFGALLFALNDEYLNARLGVAGPPEAYPAEAHARGLVGHLVLGVATDAGIDILGGG